MYFIDRSKITETVAYMNSLLELYETQKQWNSFVEQLALERLAHNMIEAVIDVGNSMIDGFIMRDPGSYEDIIDILADEQVIDPEMEKPLKEVIELRKMLVRKFMKTDHEQLKLVIGKHIAALKKFGPKVEHYLEHELGPVSAFLPEKNHEKL